MKNRLSRGSALVIVMISTLVLIILGVGFITISKILGGGREMQNAVDSGALNAAKTALIKPGTKSTTTDEAQFLGFSPNDGTNPDYYLGNINRLWGQAMLVSLNEKAMEIEGSNGANADSNANLVVSTVKTINDRVATSLAPQGGMPPQELQDAFVNSSNSNTLKMISSQAADSIQVSNGAQVGYQDQKGPSNISADLAAGGKILGNLVDPNDATAQTQLAALAKTLTDAQIASGNKQVMTGYNDIKFDQNKQIYFVPLKPNAKPHMLSQNEFSTAAPQLTSTQTPINNAFLTKGKMKEEKSGQMMDFAAIALAEPVDDAFTLSIPRGYIKVRNWKGFTMSNTVLGLHATDAAAEDGNQRGLNAAEYANHELLMARSGFKGPGVNDIFSQEMGNPYYGLTDNSGNPILNAKGDPVFGTQQDVQKLIDDNAKGKPAPTDPTCNGVFSTPLPASVACSDIGGPNGITAAADISVSVNGTGDVVATNNGPATALSVAMTQYLVKNLDVNENPWGSDIHPHLWSIDPQHVLQVWQTTDLASQPNYMTTGTASDPYAWMYTGMLKMPTLANHYGRGPSNACPITFGTAGTLWDYLQDKDPATGAANPAVAPILSRLTQRILEIKPDFDTTKLQNLLDDQNKTIGMNTDTYIYLDDSDKANPKLTYSVCGANTTTPEQGSPNLPSWIVTQISKAGATPDGNGVLGKTILYGASRVITTEPLSPAAYVENVPGDWGYNVPYTNANNPPPGAQMVLVNLTSRYVFHPCTGYQGQLAVLDLQQFVNHDGCDANYATGTTPEKCPCVTIPTGGFPCPGGNCNVNTPNGWQPNGPNGAGIQAPAPKGLPNCSHTGAC